PPSTVVTVVPVTVTPCSVAVVFCFFCFDSFAKASGVINTQQAILTIVFFITTMIPPWLIVVAYLLAPTRLHNTCRGAHCEGNSWCVKNLTDIKNFFSMGLLSRSWDRFVSFPGK